MKFIYNKSGATRLLFIFILLAFTACKKEENNIPSKTDIISFTTKDANGGPIKGALTENNEIIFYWPPEQTLPDSIAPVIKIAQNSTIKPASGTKVPFNETTSFSVTGSDGAVRSYKLKVFPYDPEPFIGSVGFSINNLFKDPTSEFYEYNQIELENVSINQGLAEFNNKIQFFLIDANNAEVPLKIVNKEDVPARQMAGYLRWLESFKGIFFVSVNNIEAGSYKKLKLKYNNHIVYYDKTINVKVRK